jgi:hypothetical protein
MGDKMFHFLEDKMVKGEESTLRELESYNDSLNLLVQFLHFTGRK